MARLYLRKNEVGSSFAISTWQSVMFSEFECPPARCTIGSFGRGRDLRDRYAATRDGRLKVNRRHDNVRSGAGPVASRSTSSMISKRCLGASLRNAFSKRRLSTVSLDGAPSFLCSSAINVGFFISHL
jgi:hypothetical protein